VGLERTRVHLARRTHHVEHLLFEPSHSGMRARVQQIPDAPRDKSVGIQIVLLDVERRILALEVAGAIALDPVAKNQILRARRRANRIGLYEAEPIDGAL
jgi:hypothetical protein